MAPKKPNQYVNPKNVIYASTAMIALALSSTANAQDADTGPLTFSANVTFASDYRFRGISQTENDFALQGGFDVSHESGFYIGTWASNLSGWGTFGGSNTELDLYGGFATDIGSVAVDTGVIWYVFPVKDKMSWEGHLSGLIVGLIFAIYFRKSIPQPKKYEWEREDYNEEDDPFLKHFDENGNFIEHIEDEPTEIENKDKSSSVQITYHFKKRKED